VTHKRRSDDQADSLHKTEVRRDSLRWNTERPLARVVGIGFGIAVAIGSTVRRDAAKHSSNCVLSELG
jgi:hypothetical protein